MTTALDTTARRGTTSSPQKTAPLLSAVVASTGSRAELDACLAALVPQCAAESVQLIVAREATTAEHAVLQAASPEVLFVYGPAAVTVKELRAIGMAAASGDIVALTDDLPARRDGWIESLLSRAPFRAGR